MYRAIDTDTWSDPWFEELAPLERLLFLYLITTSKQTSCGAFQISPRTLGYETGLLGDLPAVRDALIEKSAGRVVWWPAHNVIWVRNFYKYQRAKTSDSFRISALKALKDLPRCVQDTVATAYPELQIAGEPSYYKDIPPTSLPPASYHPGHTLPTTGSGSGSLQDQDVNTLVAEAPTSAPDKPKEKVTRKHRIPDSFGLDERMIVWAKAKGFDLVMDLEKETEEFHDYWRGRGTPMVDWVATWQSRIRQRAEYVGVKNQKGGNGNGTNQPSKLAGAISRVHEELYGTSLDEAFSRTNGRATANYKAGAIPQLPEPPETA